jgi:hypothetical protein
MADRAFLPYREGAKENGMRPNRLIFALAGGLLGLWACTTGGTVGGPNPLQNPIITRFEVFPNPQQPGKGPFEILAQASGEGVLTFSWSATGGLLSVASQSATASLSPLVPSFTAWQPPASMGTYEVSVMVTDSGGGTYRRVARFEVDRDFTRILAPRPPQIPDPALWSF